MQRGGLFLFKAAISSTIFKKSHLRRFWCVEEGEIDGVTVLSNGGQSGVSSGTRHRTNCTRLHSHTVTLSLRLVGLHVDDNVVFSRCLKSQNIAERRNESYERQVRIGGVYG